MFDLHVQLPNKVISMSLLYLPIKSNFNFQGKNKTLQKPPIEKELIEVENNKLRFNEQLNSFVIVLDVKRKSAL